MPRGLRRIEGDKLSEWIVIAGIIVIVGGLLLNFISFSHAYHVPGNREQYTCQDPKPVDPGGNVWTFTTTVGTAAHCLGSFPTDQPNRRITAVMSQPLFLGRVRIVIVTEPR